MQAEWIEEHDDQLNALGTKGIGEISIVGSPAAVLNAVWHATGVRVRELPITPDRLLGGLPERLDVLEAAPRSADTQRMVRRHGAAVGSVVLLVAVFLLLVRGQPGGPTTARAVDDVGQLLAALVASVACAWRWQRSPGRLGRPWLLLSLGTGAWCAGEAVWSWSEVVAGQQTPFPSLADAGYLLFPVLAAVGLLLWPSAGLTRGARGRALLDGVLVAGALFIVSWVTALGTAVGADSGSGLAHVVSLAYPVTDLVLLTLTVVIVANARRESGSGLPLLAVGLVSLCIADSGFAYLSATEAYATGAFVDGGWFGGFLLIAAAAVAPAAVPQDEAQANPKEQPLASTPTALLPYVPAGFGLAVTVVSELRGSYDRLMFGASAVVVGALLVRQLLAVLDNRALLRRLVEAQQELRHQAFHDPLTGLANRALFADRLRHGLELHRRDGRPIGLLYCDLDGFKTVNDTLGHDAGDEVIRAAAERLRALTRPGDTVARMGGDEFAVLLEDGGDAKAVADRLLAGFARPTAIGRHAVAVGVSVGIAALPAGSATVDAASLLRRADAAMYTAKRAGRGVAVEWVEPALVVPVEVLPVQALSA